MSLSLSINLNALGLEPINNFRYGTTYAIGHNGVSVTDRTDITNAQCNILTQCECMVVSQVSTIDPNIMSGNNENMYMILQNPSIVAVLNVNAQAVLIKKCNNVPNASDIFRLIPLSLRKEIQDKFYTNNRIDYKLDACGLALLVGYIKHEDKKYGLLLDINLNEKFIHEKIFWRICDYDSMNIEKDIDEQSDHVIPLNMNTESVISFLSILLRGA